MDKQLFPTDRIPVIGPDYDSQQYGVKNVDATIQQTVSMGVKQVIKTSVKAQMPSADNFYNEQPRSGSIIRTSVSR